MSARQRRDEDMSRVNGGFWDLDAEDRGAIYDAAERETGYANFFDMPAEMRGRYYDRAEGHERGGDDYWD
jgi:hypothetical protein